LQIASLASQAQHPAVAGGHEQAPAGGDQVVEDRLGIEFDLREFSAVGRGNAPEEGALSALEGGVRVGVVGDISAFPS